MPKRKWLNSFSVVFLTVFMALSPAVFAQDNKAAVSENTTPKQSKSEQIWQDLHTLKTLDSGPEDAPEVFVIVDPSCPHCAGYWEDLQVALHNGAKARIRMIVVGILNCESMTIAEQIYAAENPLETWRKVHQPENNPGLRLPTPDSASVIKQNHEFLLKWQQLTVPLTFYKDKNGKVQMIRARPDSVQILFENLK